MDNLSSSFSAVLLVGSCRKYTFLGSHKAVKLTIQPDVYHSCYVSRNGSYRGMHT